MNLFGRGGRRLRQSHIQLHRVGEVRQCYGEVVTNPVGALVSIRGAKRTFLCIAVKQSDGRQGTGLQSLDFAEVLHHWEEELLLPVQPTPFGLSRCEAHHQHKAGSLK